MGSGPSRYHAFGHSPVSAGDSLLATLKVHGYVIENEHEDEVYVEGYGIYEFVFSRARNHMHMAELKWSRFAKSND